MPRKKPSAARKQLKAMIAWAEPIEHALGHEQRVRLARVEIVRRENIAAALALAADGAYAAALTRLTKGPSRAAIRRATGLPDHIVQLMLGLNRARLLLAMRPDPIAPRTSGSGRCTDAPRAPRAYRTQVYPDRAPIG